MNPLGRAEWGRGFSVSWRAVAARQQATRASRVGRRGVAGAAGSCQAASHSDEPNGEGHPGAGLQGSAKQWLIDWFGQKKADRIALTALFPRSVLSESHR